jgi:hypothetical protein
MLLIIKIIEGWGAVRYGFSLQFATANPSKWMTVRVTDDVALLRQLYFGPVRQISRLN